MTYQVWVGLAALVLMGLFPWVYRAPIRGVYLIVLALPLVISPALPLLERRLALIDIFIVVTGLAWIARRVFMASARRPLKLDPKLYIPLVIYCLVALASFTNTRSPLWSTIELLTMIYLGVVFFLFTQIVQSEQELKTILKLWTISAAAVVLFGLVQMASIYTGLWQDQLLWFHTQTRITSTFNFPNQLPSYLATITPLFFFYVVRGKTIWARVGAFLFVIASFIVMFATASRTTLGLIAAMILLYWGWLFIDGWRRRGALFTRGLIAGGAVIVLLIAFIFALRADVLGIYTKLHFLPSFGRALDIVKNINLKQIDDERYLMYSVGLQAIREHPLVGVGIGSFRFFYGRVPGGFPHEMHSNVLSLWAETGTLGLFAFMAFIVIMLWYGKRIAFDTKNSVWRHLGATVVIGFITNFFVYGAFLLGLRERHLWISMALIVSLKTISERLPAEPSTGVQTA
jgi:O-antigen ligase